MNLYKSYIFDLLKARLVNAISVQELIHFLAVDWFAFAVLGETQSSFLGTG
jgi:hypothetical protein